MENRRPLRSRQWKIFGRLATECVRRGIEPNQVSLASMAGAAVACIAILIIGCVQGAFATAFWAIVAIAGIGLRVMANLIDGMIAVEGGKKTLSGEVFNDAPDRVSDLLILAPLGYVVAGYPLFVALGWLAAVLSIMTAYARMLGGACKTAQDFGGPMAKQHRMAVTVVTLLGVAFERLQGGDGHISLSIGLLVLCAGAALTV